MLTAKELWVNYNRLCDTYNNCINCPACIDHEINDILCDGMERADEFIEVVEKWAKDNPIITNRIKFKEVFGRDVLPSINCKWWPNKSCDSFNGGSITICRNCPWWDEPYEGVK